MARLIKKFLWFLSALAVLCALVATAWLSSKRPQRDGLLTLAGLSAPVDVRYDEFGVPHIQAQNQADLYRALGYVHAQDRLFQMEMARRLARGELAEILGPKLLPMDRLFRTLGLRQHADAAAQRLDPNSPGTLALTAYLDGVNQFQATRPVPLEFDLLGIPKRPFTPADSLSVAGYLAYSFAAAFRTEPVMTRIRDQLGVAYLRPFGPEFEALAPSAEPASGPLAPSRPDTPESQPTGQPSQTPATLTTEVDRALLTAWSELNAQAQTLGLSPPFEGSNAWVLAGSRTVSKKPILAGDPHIAFGAPAVWYEAHLSAPGFELYGHLQALNPMALIGHNPEFAWTLTMFQNDDVDLILEKTDAGHPDQVQIGGQWVALETRQEEIRVKGAAPVMLTLRRSPHGPIINDALPEGSVGAAPVALWWAFLATENPVMEAFHRLNRASTLAAAREAAEGIHAPGLNIVWANRAGDIAWWAAAKLPQRPAGVRPGFVLDGSLPESDKLGFLPFTANPQEENPARGYIVSANQQPVSGAAVPGYYNLPDRAQRIESRLRETTTPWTVATSRPLQLDTRTDYLPRLLKEVVPRLQARAGPVDEPALLIQLAAWSGEHAAGLVAPTVATQLLYDIARAAMADELGEAGFAQLLKTRAIDHALPRLVADADSPWWDNTATSGPDSRDDTLLRAWRASLAHLRTTFGSDSSAWTWARAHTLTHVHPLGRQAPLDKLFNVGPFAVDGGREVPNNMAHALGPAPWSVIYGPSTRRLIDLAAPGEALGINPIGQSGVWLDRHATDQAALYAQGGYRPQHLLSDDVRAHTRAQLRLRPG